MKVPFNDLKREYGSIKAEVDSAIKEVIDNTAFIKGRFLTEFEERFAAYCGTGYAVGTSSGTSALHTALSAFGIGPGDEVITVAHTFIGTTEPITHAGGDIVFVDIDPDTYTLDPAKIEETITPDTKAIVPVHLYGQIADMESILKIAREHDLIVIEDAAQAVGAKRDGKGVGHYGHAACFSFYPGKNLGAYGDAGIVVTNDADAATRMKMFVDHGRQSKYLHEFEGFNYRLDALQAAILNVKLNHIDKWNENRRHVADFYNKNLSGANLTLPVVAPGAEHVYHVYCARVKERESYQEKLKEKGVSSGIHYPVPLHLQPAYSELGVEKGALPVTEQYVDEIISLPVFPFMTDEELSYVVDVVNEVVK